MVKFASILEPDKSESNFSMNSGMARGAKMPEVDKHDLNPMTSSSFVTETSAPLGGEKSMGK